MKVLNRLVLVSLAVVFAVSLCVSPANAAPKKKKPAPEATPAPVKKRVKLVKEYITGTNLEGRAGLFYGDTSAVAPVGQWQGSLHATWWAPFASYNDFSFPLGAHFGAAKDVDLSAGVKLNLQTSPSVNYPATPFTPAYSTGGSTTNFEVLLGGKYKIKAQNSETPDFSVGGIIYIPTNGGDVIVMPKGTVTYVLPSGLLLNGDVGIGISTVTYVEIDGGVGFPVSDKITLIGEIGANQFYYADSQLGLGARFALGGTTKAQALLGVPLSGGGVLLGAGIILASE
jgi:hypothetical protein